MTHPGDATGGHPDTAALEPVPVHGVIEVTNQVPVQVRAADFGGWQTIAVPASAFSVQLIGYGEHRARCVLIISGTGPVYVGSKAQCQANPPVGGLLPTGTVVQTANKQELWLAGDGSHTATVTVLLERFES
jgi:hypothetical protein